MFDWLKFLPIQLYFGKAVNEVRGPYFDTLRSLTFPMNSCELHFRAPWSSYVWRRRSGLRGGGKSVDQNDFFCAKLQPFNGFRPTGRWGHNTFFHREWMFCGPWFTGPEAKVYLTADYIGPYSGFREKNEIYGDTTFFHPNVFESVLADYLRSRFGQSDDGSHLRYRAPVNWYRLEISPHLQAASFNLEDCDAGTVERLIAFPIADDRFVLLEFRFSEHVEGPFFPQLNALADSIVETIRLELSPAIIAKLEALRASGVNTNLSEHFAPLDWHHNAPPDSIMKHIARD